MTEDSELLTRTSWVDARVAYRQIRKVRFAEDFLNSVPFASVSNFPGIQPNAGSRALRKETPIT